LAIKGILEEAKIKTKQAIFSIPDFYTFCTSFDIPPMPENEIAGAVQYNASQYVTLPIKEVTLDWKIIAGTPGGDTPMKIFLVAVPNQVIQEYQAIAKSAGLEIYAMEAEAMGIVRALVKNNPSTSSGQAKKTVCLMDIGVQSSTVNIIDEGILKRSYSFNFYSSKPGDLEFWASPLIVELRNACAEYLQSEQKEVEEIYLAGGTANLSGLKDHIAKALGKTVLVPNCFSEFLYPPILENTLRQMSPGFSAATGVALGGLEM
jgi:type IV pilus assembly protein PilM